MLTREQCLFSLYWAKVPDFGATDQLEQIGLTEGQALLLRQRYADVLAGGARASKALAIMSPIEKDILEQYDPMPIHDVHAAVNTTLQPPASTAPWKLTVKTPAELNGLLVWLLGFGGVAIHSEKIQAATADIRKPGSMVKIAVLLDLARQLDLIEDVDGFITLTAAGEAYAQGGGAQGSERFELTATRSTILVAAWRARATRAPLYTALDEALLEYARNPGESLDSSAARWLKDLGVIVQNYLSPSGASMLHQLLSEKIVSSSGQKVTSMITHLEADLRLELAHLKDRLKALEVTPKYSSVPHPGPLQQPTPQKVWEPEIPAIDTVFQPVSDERKLLEETANRLTAAGYNISYEDLTNLYVCARSGRLTILAGPPGVGKSSLVRKFAETIGHKPSLKEVTVRRGWTDDQQFLGAVNRLHQRYDPAPTGVVHHLMVADLDREAGLYWFLLDEFNLSTPEYYFAEFISVLESPEPKVRLYNPEDSNVASGSVYPSTLPLGDNVHFFGTINLDETAYVPSPRLIDRSNFVWVERQVGLEVLNTKSVPPATVGPISAKEYLQRKRPATLSTKVEKRFQQILDVLGQEKKEYGSPQIVSPRAILGVAAYVANSVGLIAEDDALDFAVAQRVLPGLRGVGDGFFTRMEALHGTLKGLRRSQKFLRRMMDAGYDRREFDFVSSLL